VTVTAVLVTRDLERLMGFYTALFDAQETMRVPDEGATFYVGLRIGDSSLGLVSVPDVEDAVVHRILLSVEVDDVDVSLHQVAEAGGVVTGPPNDMPWGQRVAHITDPDGNPVNLTQSI
jgi:predicted enzyme related to lactoylglutathione lyase